LLKKRLRLKLHEVRADSSLQKWWENVKTIGHRNPAPRIFEDLQPAPCPAVTSEHLIGFTGAP
jgi:hypothetical protein